MMRAERCSRCVFEDKTYYSFYVFWWYLFYEEIARTVLETSKSKLSSTRVSFFLFRFDKFCAKANSIRFDWYSLTLCDCSTSHHNDTRMMLSNHPHDLRHKLDQLFFFDSMASVLFGVLALLSPHHVVKQLGGGTYNHAAHETLRYVCLWNKPPIIDTQSLSFVVVVSKPTVFLFLFPFLDCTAVCDWRAVGYYGTFDESMMASFDGTFVKPCLFATFYKRVLSCVLNLRIPRRWLIGWRLCFCWDCLSPMGRFGLVRVGVWSKYTSCQHLGFFNSSTRQAVHASASIYGLSQGEGMWRSARETKWTLACSYSLPSASPEMRTMEVSCLQTFSLQSCVLALCDLVMKWLEQKKG